MITLIAAMAENGVIGNENKLPWRVKGELQYFKQLTMGKTLYVGSTTAKDMPVLPGRELKIISRSEQGDVKDLQAFLEKHQESEEEIFIIGGAQIYKQALPYTSKIYLSVIKGDYKGDAYLDLGDRLVTWVRVPVKVEDEFTAYELYRPGML